jgi:threonine/homoserine/homoserine lactone efflux protein
VTEALTLGALFGIGSGLSVGPIFVTIIHETLTRGLRAGGKVILGSATADLLLMIPALAATWLIAGMDALSRAVALIGAAYFVYLAIQSLRESGKLWRGNTPITTPTQRGWAFAKGVIGNLLNPLTWAFWLATGTPTMLKVYTTSGWPGMAVFTTTWFLIAMAVELAIAIGVAQTRKMLSQRSLAGVQAASAATFVAVAATLVFANPR